MPLKVASVCLAAACAPESVTLECVDEATFYREYANAICVGAAHCNDLNGESVQACVDRVALGNPEAEHRLFRVCPGAAYDGCEAAACLDQLLHSPPQCGPESVLDACGTLDWYHGLCPEFSGTG